jgi:hypothetical protein
VNYPRLCARLAIPLGPFGVTVRSPIARLFVQHRRSGRWPVLQPHPLHPRQRDRPIPFVCKALICGVSTHDSSPRVIPSALAQQSHRACQSHTHTQRRLAIVSVSPYQTSNGYRSRHSFTRRRHHFHRSQSRCRLKSKIWACQQKEVRAERPHPSPPGARGASR